MKIMIPIPNITLTLTNSKCIATNWIITFIVDKDGTFEYYCSIHPEMRGKVVVM
jgi:plastocyanin